MDTLEKMKERNEIIEVVLRSLSMSMAVPNFSKVRGGVPISLAAEIMGKDQDYVKRGIRDGWLPIGVYEELREREYCYISPKLFWEFTGYEYQGKENK